jgi:hypothetical protein
VVLTVCGLMVVLTGCGGSGGQDDGPEEGVGSSSTSTPSRVSGAGTSAKTEQPSPAPATSTGGLKALGLRVKSLDGGTAVPEFFPKS